MLARRLLCFRTIIRSRSPACQRFARCFETLHDITRPVVPRLVALAMLVPLAALGADARTAVEAFVARLAGARVTDGAIEQTFTLYHPDGRRPQSTGEQRVWIKVPRRQRVEQVMEGRREVRLGGGGRGWAGGRRPGGDPRARRPGLRGAAGRAGARAYAPVDAVPAHGRRRARRV